MSSRNVWGVLIDHGIKEPFMVMYEINHYQGDTDKTSYTIETRNGYFYNAETRLGCMMKAIAKEMKKKLSK